MPIQLQGNGGVVAEVDGTGYRAQRVSLRPLDVGALGHYRASHLSGTMAAGLAANAAVFQFRWGDATRLCVVERFVLDGMAGSATAFAAGFAKFDLMVARGYSAQAASGTAVSLTGNNAKSRTSFGSSLVTLAQGSATAALTAGTHTLDAQPIGQISFGIGVVVSVNYLGQVILMGEDAPMRHPLVLATNEGLVLRATVPGTGTWQFGCSVQWSEVTAY
jgi:hypothetical protein